MKKVITMIAAVALMATAAHGSISITPSVGLVNPAADAGGTPLADGTWLMVLDLDGDGWNGVPYDAQAPLTADSATAWMWDAQDINLGIGQITNDPLPGSAFPIGTISGNPPADIDGYDIGVDEIWLLWFDKPYLDPDGPGAGVAYGAELIGTAPANGATLSPNLQGGTAGLETVPEPATMGLLGLGLGSLLLGRRRKSA